MMVALYDADDDEGKKRDLLGRTWVTFKDNFVNYRITKGDCTGEMVEMIYGKPKWWNVVYDGVDEVQGKLLFGYVLIKKEDAYKVPVEPLYPDCAKQKVHIFVVGLRDIEENSASLSQMKLKALSTAFDISGDDFDPIVTVPEKIANSGVNINTYLPITVDVPKNRALCPVLDVFVYDHTTTMNDMGDKKLLGLTTIDLSNMLQKYYMTASERAKEEDLQDQNDIVDNLDKETKVVLGGQTVSRYIDVEYGDFTDEELFRHIAWELPKRNKVLPDEEYEVKKEEEMEKKSKLKINQSQMLNKSKISEARKSSFHDFEKEPAKEPAKQMVIPQEPKRIILGDEGDSESESSQKNLPESEREDLLSKNKEKSSFNNQIAFKLAEQTNPKKFLDEDEEIEAENSFLGKSEGKIVSKEHLPVSEQNPSVKQINVFHPNEEEPELTEKEKEDKDKEKSPEQNIQELESNPKNFKAEEGGASKRSSVHNSPIEKPVAGERINGESKRSSVNRNVVGGSNRSSVKNVINNKVEMGGSKRSSVNQAIDLPNANNGEMRNSQKSMKNANNGEMRNSQRSMNGAKNVNVGSRRSSHKSQRPLVENLNIADGGDKMINPVLMPIIPEDPKEDRPFIDTLKVTSKMSIAKASSISSDALDANEIPKDNLEVTAKPPRMEPKDEGVGAKLKLFSKNLSKKLLNKMKRNEEHYEEYDTDDQEDLNIEPEWLKDREKFPDDLEDKIDMDKYIKRFPVMRGQTRGKSGQFSTDQPGELEQIAILKCIFLEGRIEETPEGIEKMNKKITKLKELMRPIDYIARVYILTGRDIQPLGDAKPNPYLKVSLGNKHFDLKNETLNKETYQPEFYKCFECPCKIPGSAFFKIEVWDGKDGVGEDDEMIGYTEIDLEDRHFTGKWREIPKKPIEMRNLKSEIMSGSQGRLELWAELIPQKLKTRFPRLNICPPPKYKFELRAIVWGTQDCVFKDELEKCNDLYVRGGPAHLEQLETDVHWRCRAKGSFNWRWKFPVNYPKRGEDDYGTDRFKISLWDKDIITADELIGENEIDLNSHKMIDKACKRLKPVKMYKRVLERGGEISDRLWYDVFHPEALDFNGNKLSQGKVQVSFELVPENFAEKKKNGSGRDAPNIYPVLPEPVGRFKFDFLNPLGMCKELIGPDLYAKCWKCLCAIICTVVLVFLLYVIATQGIAVAIVG